MSAMSLFEYSHQALNSTLLSTITPTSLDLPFYHVTRPNILSFISDRNLSLAGPVIGYWLLSGIFHFLDSAKFPYFEKRRLHESAEVLARNKATAFQVVRAVVLQHFLQSLIGYYWLEDDATVVAKYHYRDHLGAMADLAPWVADGALVALGRRSGEAFLRSHGAQFVQWMYWWGIPIVQAFVFFVAVDSWQYWGHRIMHTRFLYRMIHSVHHRLYVPYAFGALYNHPLEAVVMDVIGTTLANDLARLSVRQSILLFTFSSMKTVDDHCGYKLWWDPLQAFFFNNCDYHDIHHQVYGIKANFSQPFFVHWDTLCGTKMTRAQVNAKLKRLDKSD